MKIVMQILMWTGGVFWVVGLLAFITRTVRYYRIYGDSMIGEAPVLFEPEKTLQIVGAAVVGLLCFIVAGVIREKYWMRWK
ncbi:hypothetical protein DRQ25_13765 [Candidatus Fermentibacteria bacterium]|nr:MAG: hypothetical protein DRQ25_13765 [Candidatus Fermentibacteria bacterium]